MSTKKKYQRIEELPYKLNELEPILSYNTMNWHYNFLHLNYEIKLDEVLRGIEVEKDYPRLENLLTNLNRLPAELKEEVRFFGGGLLNHNFFFQHLARPNSPLTQPKVNEELLSLTEQFLQKKNLLGNTLSLQDFSPFEKLKRELVKSALKIRGSG